MKKQFGEYQRLARGVFGCSSLWQGKDHILYVRGRGLLIPFSEEYLRFRYRDIQALMIVATSGRMFTAIVYGLFTLLAGIFCGIMMSLRPPGEVWPLILILSFPFPVFVLFLILFVRTLALGRKCIVEIQTSLKRERFRMLTRVPVAQRVVAILDGLVKEAQQGLEVKDGEGSREDRGEISGDAGNSQLTIPAAVYPAFAVSVVIGLLMLLQLHSVSTVLAWSTQILGLVLAPLVLFALASSVRQLTTDTIRFLLWSLLVSILLIGAGAGMYLIGAAVADPAVTVSPLSYISVFAEAGSSANYIFYLYFLITGFATFLLGAIGLTHSLLWKSANHQTQ